MKLNKIFFILLTLSIAFSFAGCKEEKKTEVDIPVEKEIAIEEPTPTEEPVISETNNNTNKVEKTQEETLATDIPVTSSDLPDEEESFVCSLSVNYREVLENIHLLDDAKKSVIIDGGIIFNEEKVSYEDGESVFDVLLRELRKKEIHIEFVKTPMYNSAYIEGIANLYEFDMGEYSGWLYRVNGEKPNYGCSQYKVENGDKIEFYYSINFLEDK